MVSKKSGNARSSQAETFRGNDLFKVFLKELEDMYSAETQIIEALPKVIKQTSSPELQEALSTHLEETEDQLNRLDEIFSILDLPPQEVMCEGMRGILNEVDASLKDRSKSEVLDVIIIAGAQKVEHYEISSYGTLRSLAETLELDSQIANLLQETLDEEGAADKKLTKIAEGGLFASGINKKAAR